MLICVVFFATYGYVTEIQIKRKAKKKKQTNKQTNKELSNKQTNEKSKQTNKLTLLEQFQNPSHEWEEDRT